LVELVDCLLGPLPVGSGFATATWSEIAPALDNWIALAKERTDLRAELQGYDAAKLLALDLDALQQRWNTAQTTWFLPKWWRMRDVRRQLQPARSDYAQPDAPSVAAALKAAIRLRANLVSMAHTKDLAESFLGPIWASGEPDAGNLVLVRAWGKTLHQSLNNCADTDREWSNRLRLVLAGLFTSGPSSYATDTLFGKRLSSYRDTITRFDDIFGSLSTETPWTAAPLTMPPITLQPLLRLSIVF
jgi:hypothetical protein